MGDIVIGWDDSVSQISTSGPGPALKTGRKRWLWRTAQRPPIPVLGAGGTGKSELWRLLTGGSAEDELSKTVDQKNYFGTTKQTARTLITVPGQYGQAQRDAEDLIFKNQKYAMTGVVFVACYGYNYIWPSQVEAVDHEPEFSEFSIPNLRTRNVKKELSRFKDVCQLIDLKWRTAEDEICPKWLLVICNKADLYWDEIDTAKGYYRYGCGSSFDSVVQPIAGNLAGVGFSYHVLPAAITPCEYIYQSSRGTLSVKPTLAQAQCDASLNVIVEKLGELCGQ